jgi:signal transduction histidine kinase
MVKLAAPASVNPAGWAWLAWLNTVDAMDITADTRHRPWPDDPPGGPDGPAGRRQRQVPWSPRVWARALCVAGGIPVLAVPTILPLLIFRHGHHHPAAWAGMALLGVVLALLLTPVLTWIHRHRLRATAGVTIPRYARQPDWLTPRGLVAVLTAQRTWRQVAYHCLAAPALAAASIAAIGTWIASLLFVLEYAYALALHNGDALRQGTYPTPSGAALNIADIPTGVWLTVAGLAGLFLAPWLTAGVQRLDVRAASALLGPSRAEELEQEVEHLTQTRAGVVDAADAERRRLERDLHDGTQQRLVSLAINLGMARAQATTTEEARQAIADAHEEAKIALAELRDLIRGLHPAVLEDRGLDAALSGIAARMPIPVRLSVDLQQRRPAPVIEAVAYFVVSEGLANIAKHAQASQAEIVVQRAGERLHIIVSDDGNGGADPTRGTGLTGLRKRAESVDGTFDISSPPGGPTLLTVDLPCAR